LNFKELQYVISAKQKLMMDFLTGADIYLKTFWYIALPVSTVFLIQSVLTILGASSDTDTEIHDFDAPIEFFTIRNLINFLLGFSWGGIAFYNTIENKFLLVLASIGVGVIFVAFFFYIIQQIRKLEEDNSLKPELLLDKEAQVYLRIPPPGEGQGIIQLSVKGSVREMNAVAETESIETGEKVIITAVLEDNTYMVSKI
jgi:hypothetical protein